MQQSFLQQILRIIKAKNLIVSDLNTEILPVICGEVAETGSVIHSVDKEISPAATEILKRNNMHPVCIGSHIDEVLENAGNVDLIVINDENQTVAQNQLTLVACSLAEFDKESLPTIIIHKKEILREEPMFELSDLENFSKLAPGYYPPQILFSPESSLTVFLPKNAPRPLKDFIEEESIPPRAYESLRRTMSQLVRKDVPASNNFVHDCTIAAKTTLAEELSAEAIRLHEALSESSRKLRDAHATLKTVRQSLSAQESELRRILGTKSWRWTSSLRKIEPVVSLVSRSVNRVPYAIFGILKKIWVWSGQPCPKLVRAIRHGVFGIWKPKNSPSDHAQSESTSMEGRKKSIQEAVPEAEAVAVLLYGEKGADLAESVRQILSQVPVPKHVNVLITEWSRNTVTDLRSFSPRIRILFGDWQSRDLAFFHGAKCVNSHFVLCMSTNNRVDVHLLKRGLHFVKSNPNMIAAVCKEHTQPVGIDSDVDILTELPVITKRTVLLSAQQQHSYMPIPNTEEKVFYPVCTHVAR